MDETIGQNVSLSYSDFNLCVLGLSFDLAGCEPLGYMFSYYSLLKKPYLFKVRKNLWSFPFLPILSLLFSVSAHREHRRYLKFFLTVLYQFICISWGSGTTMRIFTKSVKAPFLHLRSMGHGSIDYIDESCMQGDTCKHLLILLINPKKIQNLLSSV